MFPKKKRELGESAETSPATSADTPKARRSLKPLLALSNYIVGYPWVLGGALIALIASASAMLVVPVAVRRMIDVGFGSGNQDLINSYFAVLILIGLALAVASSARFYFVNWLGERVVADLRSDVFRHISRLEPSFFEKTHSAEIMSRLTADTTQIKAAAGTALSQALRNGIMLIGALIMMCVTSPSLSALVLLAIPAIVLPLVAYGRLVQRLSRHAQDELASASAYAAENLAAIRTMQAYTSETATGDKFAGAVEQAFDAARARLKARAGLTALAIALTVSSIVGILWFGSATVIDGGMTGGRLGQFVLYAIFAAGALAELSEVWGEMHQAAGAAERLTELLAIVPAITSPVPAVPMPVPARGEIVFRNVDFAYPGRPEIEVLKNVSFSVAPGQTVALIGPSGAGKSTIFNLLLRFYDASSGEIEIDGVSIARANLDELRRRVALVPQDVALFADTVASNIAYGAPSASEAAVRRAAAIAKSEGFIEDLPRGYSTELGERGVSLSGGQRQRIAIARAVLRDAPILLLDEATSSLDAEGEAAVQAALEDATRGRTTLVIAHRLATVLKADRILVLDQGRIVDQGSHAELSRRGGLYGRLADLQFTSEAAE